MNVLLLGGKKVFLFLNLCIKPALRIPSTVYNAVALLLMSLHKYTVYYFGILMLSWKYTIYIYVYICHLMHVC